MNREKLVRGALKFANHRPRLVEIINLFDGLKNGSLGLRLVGGGVSVNNLTYDLEGNLFSVFVSHFLICA